MKEVYHDPVSILVHLVEYDLIPVDHHICTISFTLCILSCFWPFVKRNNYNIYIIAIKLWLIFDVAISIMW